MIVKVCGLTERTDLAALAELPIDWGGFIFVRSSPRYVGRKPLSLPTGVDRIGVFRDEPAHSVLEIARAWDLRGVQLHGRETPAEARRLRQAGLRVIKAIGVGDDGAGFARARAFSAEDVDYLLFDSPGGGTGRAFDWGRLVDYRGGLPFLLAGGIGPQSRGQIDDIDHAGFAGVDLNSRFEQAPGTKNLDLLRSFLLP